MFQLLCLWVMACLPLGSGESLSEALSSNDECAEGTCALNALQHRGKSSDPDASEEALPPGSPKWLNCDPLCPEMPVPSQASDSLGSGPGGDEEELGASRLWHAGANCWHRCHGPGECSSYCGAGNACCRWRAHHDPPVCRSVKWWPATWKQLSGHTRS